MERVLLSRLVTGTVCVAENAHGVISNTVMAQNLRSPTRMKALDMVLLAECEGGLFMISRW